MTFALNPAAGTGATYSLIGTDSYGSLSITTGTGTTSGQIGSFTFGTPIYIDAIIAIFTPINSNAQGLTDLTLVAGNFGGSLKQTTFTISGSTHIADSTTYTWAYKVAS